MHPRYIEAVAQRVTEGLARFAREDRKHVMILFSAHSVPMSVVRKGDPYTKEVATTTDLVMQQLGMSHRYMLSWQSKGEVLAGSLACLGL